MPSANLLIDPPASGVWNMAVDEALLESALATGDITLRIYQWETATVSLGYFQRLANRQSHAESLACPLVRRQSGGGAIVHDAELTYSLTLPPRHPWAAHPQRLYNAVHKSLIATLAQWRVTATMNCDPPQTEPSQEPFLCFSRRAAGDVLVGDAKVIGSAQRRSHGAVLQHGSVLLQRSTAAPQLPGIEELTGVGIPIADFVQLWSEKAAESLSVEWSAGEHSANLRSRAQQIAAEKYDSEPWLNRR